MKAIALGGRVKYYILVLHLLYICAKIQHGSIQGRTIFPSISTTKAASTRNGWRRLDNSSRRRRWERNSVKWTDAIKWNSIKFKFEEAQARPTTKTSTSEKPKKFSWTAEKAEDLLKYVREYKSASEFRGVDFEADLACMYTEVRRCMARDYCWPSPVPSVCSCHVKWRYLLTLLGRVRKKSCEASVSSTLLHRVTLPRRVTLFSCEQALKASFCLANCLEDLNACKIELISNNQFFVLFNRNSV